MVGLGFGVFVGLVVICVIFFVENWEVLDLVFYVGIMVMLLLIFVVEVLICKGLCCLVVGVGVFLVVGVVVVYFSVIVLDVFNGFVNEYLYIKFVVL